MRAIVCRELSGVGGLELADVPTPEPGPGEVRIRVRAAGLNFADTLIIRGQYQEKPALPFVPGMEIAGRIDACGPGVAGFAPGDRVMAALEPRRLRRGGGVLGRERRPPARHHGRRDRRRVRDRLRHRLWRALLGRSPAGRARRSWCTAPRAASASRPSNAAGRWARA